MPGMGLSISAMLGRETRAYTHEMSHRWGGGHELSGFVMRLPKISFDVRKVMDASLVPLQSRHGGRL